MAEMIPDPFKGTAEILETEVAKEAYKDGIAKPLKEASGLATDVIKGLRLFTRPFVLLATLQDQLMKDFEKVRKKVPAERQVESPPEIAGPVIEKLRFLEPEDSLRDLFLNLLAASIDKERQSNVHPAFPKVIEQLSRDEALLFKHVAIWAGPSFHGFEIEVRWFGISWDGDRGNVEVVHGHHLPKDGLAHPDRLYAYLKHLESLNVIELKGRVGEGVRRDTERKPLPNSFADPFAETIFIILTPFGQMLSDVIFPRSEDEPVRFPPANNPTDQPTPFHIEVFKQVEIVAGTLNLPINGFDVVSELSPSLEVVVEDPRSCRVSVYIPEDCRQDIARHAVDQLRVLLDTDPFKLFRVKNEERQVDLIVSRRPL